MWFGWILLVLFVVVALYGFGKALYGVRDKNVMLGVAATLLALGTWFWILNQSS